GHHLGATLGAILGPRRALRGRHADSVGAPGADLRVELLDQSVPGRDAVNQIAPEPLVPAPIEIRDRYSLLLHPGEIAEVEDAFAIEMAELKDMVVHNALQMTAEYLPRVDFIEAVRIAPGKEILPLADVERGAVGGDRHDHVVAAEIKMPGDLDG